jgi:biopolymer transport protein TolR
MAMGSTGSGDGLSSDINVTPLIDVLLVLLIIFMITQPLSRKAFDVQVPPEQQAKTKQAPSSQIVLELTSDGAFTINKQPYSLEQLASAFHQIYDTRPAKLLFIKAAPNRKYGDVMQAMDIAHGAGVQVIGFTPPGPAAK